MTIEYNHDDALLNDFRNPYRFENVFLFIAAAMTAAGGIATFLIAKNLFQKHEDKTAVLVASLAALVMGFAVKLLIRALAQIRFFLGRKFPLGLASEVSHLEAGVGQGAESVMETMRHQALDFPEPKGALNGVLYSLVKNLVTSPVPVQAAAVQHFHSLLGMATLLASLVVSYFVFEGTAYEGFASWLYLPLSGLSLLTPFVQPDRLAVDTTTGAETQDTGNDAVWKLMSLVVFSIMAPVLVPRIAPAFAIAPMWIAPALLLVGSMIASALFFGAVLSRLDSASRTSVSCELAKIDMNCPPAQLWTAIGRDFQTSWERNIPNRSYAHVPPDVNANERGSFAGVVLEETQPVPTSTMQFATWAEAFHTQYSRYLLLLGAWGVMMAAASAWAAVHFAERFDTMPRMEIGRAILVVIALGMVSALSFRIGHLLWSRMQFRSRLYWVECFGTFQTSTISVGNQLRGHAQSSSTLTRVEDATLRVWVTDVVSVAFGKDSQRSIIAMGPADGVAKALSDRLIEFAASQSSVAIPTTEHDLSRAAAIGTLDAAVRQASSNARKAAALSNANDAHREIAAPAQAKLIGRVKFYNVERRFGYIAAENGTSFFFNKNDIEGSVPACGDQVAFMPTSGGKGPRARNVTAAADHRNAAIQYS